MIYLVTTITKFKKNEEYGWYDIDGERLVGYFNSYEKAKECVVNNDCDIYEGIYKYATIEGIEDGLYPKVGVQELYEIIDARDVGLEPYYSKIDASDGFFSKNYSRNIG